MLPRGYESGALGKALFPAFFFSSPFLYLVFWRRRPPVRIDGKRRIVYTWQPARLFGLWPGQLFIAHYTTHDLVAPTPRRYDAVAGGTRSGPVRLKLRAGETDRLFSVGHFAIFPSETRASEAWSFATMVLGPNADEVSDALPKRFRLPWWTRTSLLGMRRFPRDLDARVDRWMAENLD